MDYMLVTEPNGNIITDQSGNILVQQKPGKCICTLCKYIFVW